MSALHIHEAGAKAQRDRQKISAKYAELCTFANVPMEPESFTAELTNNQFYRLCEDTYNRLPHRVKLSYGQFVGVAARVRPLAFRWYLADRLRGSGVVGRRRAAAVPLLFMQWLQARARFRKLPTKSAKTEGKS